MGSDGGRKPGRADRAENRSEARPRLVLQPHNGTTRDAASALPCK
jgi:hypothetical protein